MPRDKRINLIGGVYHVITRGIERKLIFKDDKDYKEFLTRLKESLQKTKSFCYAWVLMPNHVHLMIKTGKGSLTDIMRRLLTGYAVYFNKRYRRHGYLYQNRYKSVLCQEDAYFQELIRYIHLNPLRSGIVKNISGLDNYPYSGHIAIIGKKTYDFQNVDEIFLWFGKNRNDGIRKYRDFITDGVGKKCGVDFSGGGIIRSIGGWSKLLAARRKKEYWRGDERILGNDSFIALALKAAEENINRRDRLIQEGWNLSKLTERVCGLLRFNISDIKKKGRSNNLSEAKGLICYWGCKELGLSGREVGYYLDISRQAVAKNVEKGEMIAGLRGYKLTN